MKVALVHDWLTGMRGGEKCLEAICELFPQATLFTLLHQRGRLSPAIEAMEIRTSWIQRLPARQRYYRHLLPLFPAAVESLDLRGYELIISTSHCVAKGVRVPPGSCHFCYCFTPMRYAWDQFEHYFGAHRVPTWKRLLATPLMERLRRWDAATAVRVHVFAAISRFVADRIDRAYGRRAAVIYPPVETERFGLSPSPPGDYYLMVSALAPYKRVDLAIEAFGRLGRPLRIVGTGQDERRLRRLDRGNVRFLGWLPPEEVAAAYAGCRALVYPVEEDFGIAPVEALASGRPVIAYGAGGVTETVRPHPDFPAPGTWPAQPLPPTGVFFSSQDSAALAEAVRFFEARAGEFSPQVIRASSLPFGRERFRTHFSRTVEAVWERFQREGSGIINSL